MTKFLFPLLSLMTLSGEDLRFTHTYKQGYDTSCGVAAAASLLTLYWNIPAVEADMYQDMILNRAGENAASYTVSFLTIADYLKQKAVQSKAYKMGWPELEDTLGKGYAPVLINYDKPRPHFALLLHIDDGFAFVADPAKGFELVERKRFEKNYSGNALLTASRSAVKNTGRIEAARREETARLERLRRLARMRGW